MPTDLFGGSGALNGNWSVQAGSFIESGGNCYGDTASTSSLARYAASSPGDDHEASVIFVRAPGGDFIGPAVRIAPAAFTCANVDCSDTALYVSTWAAGSQTVIIGPQTPPANGTKITLRAVGTQLRLYFDSVEQTGLGSPWTPGGLPSTGTWGISAYSSGGTNGASEWEGVDLSVPPPPAVPPPSIRQGFKTTRPRPFGPGIAR